MYSYEDKADAHGPRWNSQRLAEGRHGWLGDRPASSSAYIYIYIYIYTHVDMCISLSLSLCIYIYIYVHIYTYGMYSQDFRLGHWVTRPSDQPGMVSARNSDLQNEELGVNSQNHCSYSHKNLWKLTYPRGWTQFSRLNCWTLAVIEDQTAPKAASPESGSLITRAPMSNQGQRDNTSKRQHGNTEDP